MHYPQHCMHACCFFVFQLPLILHLIWDLTITIKLKVRENSSILTNTRQVDCGFKPPMEVDWLKVDSHCGQCAMQTKFNS